MLKWGIFGTGGIAGKFVQTLNALGYGDNCAIGSRSVESAKRFADNHGINEYYGSYEELCKDDEIDIIYIATPMHSHYGDIKLCIEYHKHILCEKAITVNASQLEELIDLAQTNNLFLMEAMWTKTLPVFLDIKHTIESGTIGDLRVIKADLSNLVPVDYNSRLFSNELGGGSLLDISVYLLSFAMAFLGNEPTSIDSAAYIRNNVDFDNHITLKYPNAYADLSAGMSSYSPNCATLIGTEGIIQTADHFYHAESFKIYDKDYQFIEERSFKFDHTGFEYQILECEKMISENKLTSDLHPISDSLAVMKIIDQCKLDWGLQFEADIDQ